LSFLGIRLNLLRKPHIPHPYFWGFPGAGLFFFRRYDSTQPVGL
jgi:hypothetical protein